MTQTEAADLLGVGPDASISEVQRAFVSASRSLHPDLLMDATEAERHAAGLRFARAREARDVLVAGHPVIPVTFDPTYRPVRGRGIGGSVVVLLLLAAVLVVSVSAADAYRIETVENLRGGVVQTP